MKQISARTLHVCNYFLFFRHIIFLVGNKYFSPSMVKFIIYINICIYIFSCVIFIKMGSVRTQSVNQSGLWYNHLVITCKDWLEKITTWLVLVIFLPKSQNCVCQLLCSAHAPPCLCYGLKTLLEITQQKIHWIRIFIITQMQTEVHAHASIGMCIHCCCYYYCKQIQICWEYAKVDYRSIVLNIAEIPIYRPKYRYFIQNDTLSVKIYRISFWTDMGPYIATWPIYRPISEMKYLIYRAIWLLIWIIIIIFYLRDHFILFYAHYDISMMFLCDVCITLFFNNVLYVFTIDISTGIQYHIAIYHPVSGI